MKLVTDVSISISFSEEQCDNGEPAKFEMRVVKSFRDPLSRQVTEAVLIKNHSGEILNSKSEFHQPPLVRIRNEIIRG